MSRRGAEADAFVPKSIQALRAYDLRKFSADLIAGVTVGLVALPMAMAFAIASGVPPESGIYCAIVAGFLVSALGGSATQIAGPTGAFVVVVRASCKSTEWTASSCARSWRAFCS